MDTKTASWALKPGSGSHDIGLVVKYKSKTFRALVGKVTS